MKEYMDLLQNLYNCQDLPGLDFAKVIGRNIEVLQEKADPLNAMLEPSEEFRKIIAEIQECKGDPQKIKAVEDANPEIIKERKKQTDLVNSILEEKIEVKLQRIPEEILPKEMTARQYRGIQQLID